ncbi:MAG TPA: substrate-binding domain-containing protein [Rhodothermales bacterium]|nr:substrate-binding domain-containing protein [Rhodothermales bacterium]
MRVSLLSGLLLAILLLAGCNRGSSSDRLQIAVIPKGTTHQFWKSIHAGANKAASELDVEVIWQGPQREDDRQMQIQVVQNFVSRGISSIVLAPLDSRALVPHVEAAVRREIPVIIIDSDLDSDVQSSFVATNNREGGHMCARRLADILGRKGRVIMLRVMEGGASTTNREEGFLEEIKVYAPDIEILVDNQFGGATVEKALQVSQNLLNRFNEIDGIFTANESTTQGMLRALQTAGRAGSVKFVGFDSNETLLDGMRDGQIHGLAVQDPFDMGYRGVHTAVAVLKGLPFEKHVDTRIMMITPDNIQTDEAQSLLNPDLTTWLN